MNCGIDMVQIDRFNNISSTFMNKYFSINEINYINSKGNNSETIAGIYAAKEAFLKSIGVAFNKYSLKEIEILHDNGKPYFNINEQIKKEIDKPNFSLSISHEDKYAIAFVINY